MSSGFCAFVDVNDDCISVCDFGAVNSPTEGPPT